MSKNITSRRRIVVDTDDREFTHLLLNIEEVKKSMHRNTDTKAHAVWQDALDRVAQFEAAGKKCEMKYRRHKTRDEKNALPVIDVESASSVMS